MEENNKIELRSEKVRNIIGQIPSSIIRMGSAVIFIVLLLLLTGAYFFRFDHTIKVSATLYPENNQIYYVLKVPINKMKNVNSGQKMVITVHGQNYFVGDTQQVDTLRRVSQEKTYFTVKGIVSDEQFRIEEKVKAEAKIHIGKTNIINYILDH